jgi:hypothetical protein
MRDKKPCDKNRVRIGNCVSRNARAALGCDRIYTAILVTGIA